MSGCWRRLCRLMATRPSFRARRPAITPGIVTTGSIARSGPCRAPRSISWAAAMPSPSRVSKGGYEFIQGGLDDLDRLPTIRPPPAPARAAGTSETPAIHLGHRNSALWKHCMRQAHHCDDFDALLDVAHTFNENCLPPLEEAEVVKTAKSAWQYTERGQNRFGQHGAFFPIEEVHAMLHDQDAFFLLAFLRANQGPWATFMCANGLAQTFGWPRVRFASARRRLIELGYLRLVRAAARGVPAMYQWA